MKVRFVEITTGEELLLTKCAQCSTGFAVAAMSKTYSGMLEARCFDCDNLIGFYTSKHGENRTTWALAAVEKQTGPLNVTEVKPRSL